MRITKFGHACVRIEHDDRALLVDPGGWTAEDAVDAVDAVLITHEHPDHYDPEMLRRTDAPLFTIQAVADRIREGAPDLAERVTVVQADDEFDPGLPVRVVGELHAVIHPDYPRILNSGYVITAGEARIYHPGDALTPVEGDIDLLCVPVSAPWLKVSEAIDFARTVGAPRNLAIHDRVYSEAGLGIVDMHMARLLPESQSFSRIADGADL